LRASDFDINSGGLISGAGTLSGIGGGNQTIVPPTIDNNGTIEATGGNLLVYGNIAGTGVLSVVSGATMTLQGEVGSNQTLAFSSHATVVIADPYSFHGTITGFDDSDVLVIGGTQATNVSWSSGVLTVDFPSGPLQYVLGGNFEDGFNVNANAFGGSNVRANLSGVGDGHGDVHMTTFSGLMYDFQAVGDFVVLQSLGASSPWQIQVRTISAAGATSITEVLGTRLGDDHVTFSVGRNTVVHINGAADTSLQVGDIQRLSGGTLARPSSNFYELDWNDGRSVTVTDFNGWFLDWTVALGPQYGPGSVHGLLGSYTGPASDFQLPNGTVLGWLKDDQIRTFYADAWRVAPGQSLLGDPTDSAHAQLAQAMATGPDPAGAAGGPVVTKEDTTQLAVGAVLTTPQHV
jgi:VWD domain-containing protein